MEFLIQQKIMSDFDGYNNLINLNNAILQSSDNEIILDFKNNRWFEANLFAILGAFRSLTDDQQKNISIINLSQKLQNVLQRNRFLFEYGGVWVPDLNGTIITYKKFKPTESSEFMDYILNELLSKPDFPKHTAIPRKKNIIEN